ncbi:MAG: CBS domain-containing protein [Clostridiales bacterium]|nr:CBS domain-containing protein [Clostridiales bacterium]
MKVKDVMTSAVSYGRTDDTIDKIAKQMKDLDVGSIPICNNAQNVVGIATDRDIVTRAIGDGIDPSEKVEKIMSTEPISISPEAHVNEAADLMARYQIRRLPVVDNGKLVGVLSIGDLAVRNTCEHEAGKALSDISSPSRPML